MFKVFTVDGHSMNPAIKHGDMLYVDMSGMRRKSVKKGDIIVFKAPDSKRSVKRISAISDSAVWVLGDNSKASKDSRQYGWVPVKRIIGVVEKNIGKSAGKKYRNIYEIVREDIFRRWGLD